MSADRTLFLHIGHGKTGTSYLQSVLAGSRDALAADGLFYPPADDTDDAANGAISSGNGTMLLDRPIEDLPPAPDGVRGVVFSCEMLFGSIRERGFLADLQQIAQRYGCPRISVLLFVRNPIGHLSSAYQQAVKRRGYADEIDAFAPRFNIPRAVVRVLDLIDREPNVSLTLHNYDALKADLAAPLAHFLGLSPGRLTAPPIAVVNRSLSAAELAVQLRLNRVLGASGEFAADPLCEELPGVRAAMILPSMATQREVITRNREFMDAVNRRLPPREHYRADLADPSPEQQLAPLSTEQADIVLQRLAEEIQRLRQRQAAMDTPAPTPAPTPPPASAKGRALGPLKRLLRWRT